MRDLPGIFLVAAVWAYWFGVGIMIVRVRRETKTLAGLVPGQIKERLMWLVWVPLVAAWIVVPYMALHGRVPWAASASLRTDPVYSALRWLAAAGAVLSLLLTSACWARMGRQWRMDVGNARKSELITDGPFRFVRHPIYALSRLLMGCSVVVVASWPMLVLAVVHFLLTQIKARHEELHLVSVHGAAYREYCEHTGRFLPERGTTGDRASVP